MVQLPRLPFSPIPGFMPSAAYQGSHSVFNSKKWSIISKKQKGSGWRCLTRNQIFVRALTNIRCRWRIWHLAVIISSQIVHLPRLPFQPIPGCMPSATYQGSKCVIGGSQWPMISRIRMGWARRCMIRKQKSHCWIQCMCQSFWVAIARSCVHFTHT